MYLVASVRPSVSQSTLGFAECSKRAKKSHCQSGVFVCVSNSRADAVDRLLIIRVLRLNKNTYIFHKMPVLYDSIPLRP